jgi:hypothetical protein
MATLGKLLLCVFFVIYFLAVFLFGHHRTELLLAAGYCGLGVLVGLTRHGE